MTSAGLTAAAIGLGLTPSASAAFATPGVELLPDSAARSDGGFDTAVGGDGTTVMAYKDDPDDDGNYVVMARVRPPGGAWSTPVMVSPGDVDAYYDVSVDVGPSGGSVVAWGEDLAGDLQDPVVVRTLSADGTPGPRLEVAATDLDSGPVVRRNQGGDILVTWIGYHGSFKRVSASLKPSGSGAFPAPKYASASSRNAYPDYDAFLADTGRAWIAYSARQSAGDPWLPYWASYRYSPTPADNIWHTDLITGTAVLAGNAHLAGNPEGHVLFTANSSSDVHTRSWATGGPVIDPTPPAVPTLRDEVVISNAYARQSHVAGGGQEYLLLTQGGNTDVATRAIDTAWSHTQAVAGVAPARMLVGPASTAVVTTSSDGGGSYLDVHRVAPGASSTREQHYGPAAGTFTLVAGNAEDGDGFIVYRDSEGSPAPMYWLNEDGTSAPQPKSVALASLPTWTLSPQVNVTWTTQASEVELQRQVSRATSGSPGPWVQLAKPASTPTMVGLAAGSTNCFRARDTTDTGAWAPGPSVCTTAPVDDRGLAGRKGWKQISAKSYYRGTALKTTSKNRSLRLAVTQSKSVVLVAMTCPKCGKVKLTWKGGAAKTVNLKSSKTRRQVVIAAPKSYRGDGLLKIKVLTRGKLVVIDGVGSLRQ